ncbi:MAG: SOS response-associated peptidase [Elusimicrobia bacterium]|nr:SOS response-associated peptidase [Elusimicrobiota bacterium]
MCGRYTQTSDARTLAGRFRLAKLGVDVPARYNISPGQPAPVVLIEGGRRLALHRWGLVPGWAEDPRVGYKMINARADSAPRKPAFREPFQRRRCLVPADGFYEWRRAGKGKVPIRFTLAGGGLFSFAGLWDEWRSPEGEVLRSFTILTTEANAVVAPVHDRMPVILREDGESAWLDSDAKTHELEALLVPYEPSGMRAREASARLNSGREDHPGLLEPEAPLQPELGL